MMQALIVIIVFMGLPAVAQRNFRDIVSSLSSEIADNSAGTSGSAFLTNASTDSSAAVPTPWPRRLGLPCNTDAECLASLGLSCQFWVCACAPQTPVKVETRGELRCVPARSLYQPCRFHQECNHTSGPMRCVERLCLCPAPFEPTSKGGCAAPRPSLQARLTSLVDAATPATAALVIAALLMAAFFFVRMLPRSKSRSGSASSDELCSAQAPLRRKLHSAYPSATEIPRHLRGLPLRQNAPQRALPIRRIRMPPAMEAGTPASAGSSAVAIASSAESVMVETSKALSPAASVHSNETKVDESSRPGSVSSKAVSPSSDDVADVHGTNKGPTTSLAGMGLLAAPARLSPRRSATSTLSLSIKWGANKSSTSSSTNNKVAVPKKSLKSAMVPGKAAVPDDDDSEVPSGLTCYGRQKSVAFVETKPKGGEPSSPTEASEGNEQSYTTAGARSPGVRQGAKFSPQHSTTEASEEVTVAPDKACSATSPSSASDAGTSENVDTLGDDRAVSALTEPSTLLTPAPSDDRAVPDLALESGHYTKARWDSGASTGWNATDYSEPPVSSAADASSGTPGALPPIPLKRRRFQLGTTTMSEKAHGQEVAHVAMANTPGNVKPPDDTARDTAVEEVDAGAYCTGVLKKDLQSKSVEGTPCNTEPGLSVTGFTEMIPSIKVDWTSGFEGLQPTAELWELGQVDGVKAKGMPVSASGSFTAREDESLMRVASFRGLYGTAGAPVDATCPSYSDLQSQGWPPAFSRGAWGSFEKVPFTEMSDTEVAMDFDGLPAREASFFHEQREPDTTPWSLVDKLHPSPRAGTLNAEDSARPTPMKRSLMFRRNESSQMQAASHVNSKVEPPFSPSAAPLFSESETCITSLMELEAIPDDERQRISATSVLGVRTDKEPKVPILMSPQETPSELLEQTGPPGGTNGIENSTADTSTSSSIGKKPHVRTAFGFRHKQMGTLRGSVARRQYSEPLPNQRLAVIRELKAEKSGASSSSWTTVSSVSIEAEEDTGSGGETRLSWSSPALVVSACEDASHSLPLDDRVLSVLVDLPPNVGHQNSSSSTPGTGGSLEACRATEPERSGLADSQGVVSECLPLAQVQALCEARVAPSPLPRRRIRLPAPASLHEDDRYSSTVGHTNASPMNGDVPQRELKAFSTEGTLMEPSSKMETCISAEATPTSVRSPSDDNRTHHHSSGVRIVNEHSSDTLKEQPPFTFPPAAASTSMTFVVSTVADSSSSRDSLLSSAIRPVQDLDAADYALSPSSGKSSVTLKTEAVHPPRAFLGHRSMSSESLSLSLRAKVIRWQRLSTIMNATATADTAGAPGRRGCFSVEMLSSSSAVRPPLREQPDSSMSFSVLESPGPHLLSTMGESTALFDEERKYDCSTLRSSVRDRAIEGRASMPFSRAQLASLDAEQRSSSCEESGKETTGPRFGNLDCS